MPSPIFLRGKGVHGARTLKKFPVWEGEPAGGYKVNMENWRRVQTLERGCSFCWCYVLPRALWCGDLQPERIPWTLQHTPGLQIKLQDRAQKIYTENLVSEKKKILSSPWNEPMCPEPSFLCVFSRRLNPVLFLCSVKVSVCCFFIYIMLYNVILLCFIKIFFTVHFLTF